MLIASRVAPPTDRDVTVVGARAASGGLRVQIGSPSLSSVYHPTRFPYYCSLAPRSLTNHKAPPPLGVCGAVLKVGGEVSAGVFIYDLHDAKSEFQNHFDSNLFPRCL